MSVYLRNASWQMIQLACVLCLRVQPEDHVCAVAMAAADVLGMCGSDDCTAADVLDMHGVATIAVGHVGHAQ
jgi:hypothetical protein